MDEFEKRLREEIDASAFRVHALKDELREAEIRHDVLSSTLGTFLTSRGLGKRIGSHSPEAWMGRVGHYARAVLRIVHAAGEDGVRLTEINRLLRRHGETVNVPRTRSVLYERQRAGVVERIGTGVYRIRPDVIEAYASQTPEMSPMKAE